MDIQELCSSIDLHDLATRVGMRRPGGKGKYHAPWREDRTPSLVIFTGKDGKQRWHDHGTDEGGDAIELMARVRGLDSSEAIRELHQLYGIPFDRPTPQPAEFQQETKPQRIWRNTKSHPRIEEAAKYLTQVRMLLEIHVNRLKGKAFGFSDWQPKEGDVEGHGPAVVFPVITKDGQIIAVNMRYLADGHEPKMRIIGEMAGGLFCLELAILKAPVIWLTESPIDALTLTFAGCPAVAIISASNADSFPLSWLNNRQRLMILMDSDQAGKKAQETLYHRALSAGITPQIVDWPADHKDPNDALKAGKSLEEIATLAGKARMDLFPAGNPPMPLPEYKRLRMYSCGLDATECVKLQNVDGMQEETLEPVAGFRVFRIDLIAVHDPVTALGGTGHGPAAERYLVLYRRSDSPYLHRRIIDQKDIGKPTVWQELGHLHNPRNLARMLQTLSRDQRQLHETVGVVGLVMVGKKVCLVDASNAHLDEETCIYHRLRFPSAPQEKALPILQKLDGLLKDGLGLIWFAWHVGALMKVFLGFWPHLSVDGHSGSGKTLIATRVMAGLTGCLSKEPSELQTPYRRMKVVSNHVYPVIFDEISRANPRDLADFVDLLNSSYRYDLRHHGTSRQFLLSAPVAMIGQDNPVQDAAINTKTISFELDGAKVDGGLFTPDGPFPTQEWAEWLMSRWNRERAEIRLKEHKQALSTLLKAGQGDTNVDRFLENYAALGLAMEELFAFSGYENDQCKATLVVIMNTHLRKSEVIRRESVAILDRLAREITLCRDQDMPPYKVERGQLVISPTVALDFLSARGHHFPVKTPQRLIAHLESDGFLLQKDTGRRFKSPEGGQNRLKCVVLDLKKLEEAGIDWPGYDQDSGMGGL